MRTIGLMTGAIALTLFGTGCATHKYVTKTVAPIEQRVAATEGKNSEQDKQIAVQGTHLEEIDRDASKTRERVTEVDAKAVKAGEDARMADQKAANAQQSADGAKQAADNARTSSQQSVNQLAQSMYKFHMLKSETILFDLNTSKLSPDAKEQLNGLSKDVSSHDHYLIEVQGFTDKTGDAIYNETLSEDRAQSVARYLANQFDIPVRSISTMGSGYARPVGDDSTRDGRKMNRRVEVRVWIPEGQTPKTVAADTSK